MEGNTSSALVGAVEAVLFACGEPVSLARLQEACHVGKPEICQALETLEQQYRRRKSAHFMCSSWRMPTSSAHGRNTPA